MKTNFKKMALAAATTAAVAGSMSAQAVIMGVPGEAVLVPYVVTSPSTGTSATNFGANASTTLPFADTVVRFTVPVSVGADTVIGFTAPHVGVSTDAYEPQIGLESGENVIHWVYFNSSSVHTRDGDIIVTPDDVAIWDACTYLTNCSIPANIVANQGYLVAVTQQGEAGNAADFAFFADAFVTVTPTVGALAGTVENVLAIPVLPMADGADTVGVTTPSYTNNVIEMNGPNWEVAPIVSGIRTNGANPLRVIDLTLADTTNSGYGTFIVAWNDRNLGTGTAAQFWDVEFYDTAENECSTTMSMPNEVNTYLVTPSSAWSTSQPILGQNPTEVTPCYIASEQEITGVQGSGFLKLTVQAPGGVTSAAGSTAAMFAFSLPVTVDTGSDTVDAYSTVQLPHDRGSFGY